MLRREAYRCRANRTVRPSRPGTSRAPILVLLHGGGPDHYSLEPLARQLADRHEIVLPDIRGYGRSVYADPERHTWNQYAADVIALLDRLGVDRAVVGGVGLGTTITFRTARTCPESTRPC